MCTFPRASRSPSQGHSAACWHRGRPSDAISLKSRVVVHANARDYQPQRLAVPPHILEVLCSDAGRDGTQDSDRPILQVRGGIAAVRDQSVPQTLFDLTERSCCMQPNREAGTSQPGDLQRRSGPEPLFHVNNSCASRQKPSLLIKVILYCYSSIQRMAWD